MPRYQFRCRACESAFEVDRPMSQASDPAPCPAGHSDTVRLLSVFAAVSGSGAAAPSYERAAPPGGGGGFGGCGGACACAH